MVQLQKMCVFLSQDEFLPSLCGAMIHKMLSFLFMTLLWRTLSLGENGGQFEGCLRTLTLYVSELLSGFEMRILEVRSKGLKVEYATLLSTPWPLVDN